MAIVDHITAGGLALDWLTSPTSNASANYVVGRDGTVYQLVRDADAAWCNGVDFDDGWEAYRSDLTIGWIADCWQRRYSPNLVTVSIEHEAKAGQALTESQYQATLALHRWLCAEYGIPVDRQHIVGHCAIDAVNRSADPGGAWPWARLLTDLR